MARLNVVVKLTCGLTQCLILDAKLLVDSCFLDKLREMLSTVYHDVQKIESFLVVNFLNCIHQLLELVSSVLLIEFRLSLNHLF